MKFVKLNPMVLQYDGLDIPRPSSIPFNNINYNKIKIAGTSNGLLMVVFMNDEGKAESTINWFRMVPSKIIEGVITGDHYIIEHFVEQALSGLYPVYVEDNLPYFL